MTIGDFFAPRSDDKPKPKSANNRRRHVICKLEKEEHEGYREACKSFRLPSWKQAIMKERNIENPDFEVDEKTGELFRFEKK